MKGPDLMEEEQSRGSATSFEDQEILRGAGGMSWPRKKLELLAADEPYSFVGGPFGSKLTSRDYSDQGIPVIRGSNLNNGRFLDMNEFVYVSDSKVRKDLSGNLAKPGDLVFTQRGTLGQVAIIPKEGISDRYVVSQSQMKLTVDDTKADQFFLYYYFSSREVIDRITNFTSSSGVPHINLTVLRNFEIPVPPLEIQKSIASILSAYDDLIENNRRRIQLLEQAARLLYKEWFVRLRFPGHEHVRVMDGVPEGWERKTAFDEMDILSGGTPKTGVPDYWNGDIPFFTPKDSMDYAYALATEKRLTEEGLRNCNSKLYPKDTIFITARGTVGKINLAQTAMAMNQSCYALKGKNDFPALFVFSFTRYVIATMKKKASGAVFSALVTRDFEMEKVFEPNFEDAILFEKRVEPLFAQILANTNEIQQLLDLQNALLTQLSSR